MASCEVIRAGSEVANTREREFLVGAYKRDLKLFFGEGAGLTESFFGGGGRHFVFAVVEVVVVVVAVRIGVAHAT